MAREISHETLTVRHYPHLPVYAASFYGAADDLVSRAVNGDIPYRKIPEAVKGVEAEVPVRPTVPRGHKRYLQRETIGTFLEAVFGRFDDSEKYRLFGNLLDILGPLQGAFPTHLEYGLEFPLRPNDDRRTHIVAFWLDLVLRILDYPPVQPAVFWTESENGAESSRLDLFLSAPDPATLLGLLGPSRPNRSLYSLQRDGERSPADAASSLPEAYDELLENEQVRLWDFLRRV